MNGWIYKGAALLCCLFLLMGRLNAGEKPFAVIVKGNLTTSSLLYPNNNAADEILRTTSYPVGSFFGTSIELRYRFPESNAAVGVSADYLRAKSDRSITAGSLTVPVEDGYRVIPVEVTGYFIIPFSGPTFGVFMGGGAGLYFGRREYTVAGVAPASVSVSPGFGIHVLGGVSYRLNDLLSLTAEMKFRDLQFEETTQFTKRIRYQGTLLNIGTSPETLRVQTDGMIFQLGVAISF